MTCAMRLVVCDRRERPALPVSRRRKVSRARLGPQTDAFKVQVGRVLFSEHCLTSLQATGRLCRSPLQWKLLISLALPDCKHAGDRIHRIPDGETGVRSSWIHWKSGDVRGQFGARTRSDRKDGGGGASPRRLRASEGGTGGPAHAQGAPPPPRLRVRDSVDPDMIVFQLLGHADHAKQSYSIFRRLRDDGVNSDWIKNKDINVFVQFAPKKRPDLPNVPLIGDLASSAEDKHLLLCLCRAAVCAPVPDAGPRPGIGRGTTTQRL